MFNSLKKNRTHMDAEWLGKRFTCSPHVQPPLPTFSLSELIVQLNVFFNPSS